MQRASIGRKLQDNEGLVLVKNLKLVSDGHGGSAIMSPNHPVMMKLLSLLKGDTASFVPLHNVPC